MMEALLGFGLVAAGIGCTSLVANGNGFKGRRAAGYKPSDFNQVQLRRGTKVELEHGTNRKAAQRIAMDHLVEDPRYYRELAKMERKLERTKKKPKKRRRKNKR